MSEEIYGYYDTPEPYAFLGIMFANWTDDELAYMHHKVMHPSYGSDEESS